MLRWGPPPATIDEDNNSILSTLGPATRRPGCPCNCRMSMGGDVQRIVHAPCDTSELEDANEMTTARYREAKRAGGPLDPCLRAQRKSPSDGTTRGLVRGSVTDPRRHLPRIVIGITFVPPARAATMFLGSQTSASATPLLELPRARPGEGTPGAWSVPHVSLVRRIPGGVGPLRYCRSEKCPES